MTPDVVRELAENKAVIEWLQTSNEKWVQSLAKVIDGLVEVKTISADATSESLARGIIALRDGLYNSLYLGSEVKRVRKAWVDIMSILMKQALDLDK
ncbi:MAG: hypothetical protein ACETWM_20440 [Candidatus Lokiarchaeia archaeon]